MKRLATSCTSSTTRWKSSKDLEKMRYATTEQIASNTKQERTTTAPGNGAHHATALGTTQTGANGLGERTDGTAPSDGDHRTRKSTEATPSQSHLPQLGNGQAVSETKAQQCSAAKGCMDRASAFTKSSEPDSTHKCR